MALSLQSVLTFLERLPNFEAILKKLEELVYLYIKLLFAHNLKREYYFIFILLFLKRMIVWSTSPTYVENYNIS